MKLVFKSRGEQRLLFIGKAQSLKNPSVSFPNLGQKNAHLLSLKIPPALRCCIMCHYIRWRGAEGTARREDARVARPLPEENSGAAEARFSAPKAELSLSESQQSGGTERLSSSTSASYNQSRQSLSPGNYRPPSCTHVASRNHHLGVAPRAGMGCDVTPLLTTAGVTRGREAARLSQPWPKGHLGPSCNTPP